MDLRRRRSGRASPIRRLLEHACRQEPTLIAVESTGGYERPLVIALQAAGLPVVPANPWRVHRFGEGLGRLAKTDPIHARLLALYAEKLLTLLNAMVRNRTTWKEAIRK